MIRSGRSLVRARPTSPPALRGAGHEAPSVLDRLGGTVARTSAAMGRAVHVARRCCSVGPGRAAGAGHRRRGANRLPHRCHLHGDSVGDRPVLVAAVLAATVGRSVQESPPRCMGCRWAPSCWASPWSWRVARRAGASAAGADDRGIAVVGAACCSCRLLRRRRVAGFAQTSSRPHRRGAGREVRGEELILLRAFAMIVLLLTVPAVSPRSGAGGPSGPSASRVPVGAQPGPVPALSVEARHLLPTLVCVALLLGVALRDRRRLLVALVVAQLLYAVGTCSSSSRQPERGHRARFSSPRVGCVVVDVDCGRDTTAWKTSTGPGWSGVNCAMPWAGRN